MEVEERLKELVELLKEFVSEIEKKRIQLFRRNWLDSYNGLEGEKTTVVGWEIEVSEFREVVERAIRLYTDEEEARITKIVLTTDGEILIEYYYRVYNQYGRHVGTEYGFTDLQTVVKSLQQKQPTIDLKTAIQKALERLL